MDKVDETKKLTKKIAADRLWHLFSFLLIGFVGGFSEPMILGWIHSVSSPTPSDAISIANTYIVFTTIIFVGITAIITVVGYRFAQQFAASKDAQETQIFDDLRTHLKDDEEIGLRILKNLLENRDVKSHLMDVLDAKVNELIRQKTADAKNELDRAEGNFKLTQALAEKLCKSNGADGNV